MLSHVLGVGLNWMIERVLWGGGLVELKRTRRKNTNLQIP
jgi:hypothetical protein